VRLAAAECATAIEALAPDTGVRVGPAMCEAASVRLRSSKRVRLDAAE
jgi:hypothetical protein